MPWIIIYLLYFFFFMLWPPPSSTLFPYTTLFRSVFAARIHDAAFRQDAAQERDYRGHLGVRQRKDRKSTRLNSSHRCISYAVFCLKKKKRCGSVPPIQMHER